VATPTPLSDEDKTLLENGIYRRLRPPPELRARLEQHLSLLMAAAVERGQKMVITPDGERLITRFIGKRSHTLREIPFCRLQDFLPKKFRRQ